jgi:MoxR-like ATPase
LIRASQAAAYVRGETFVRPFLVKKLAPHVLAHRVILHPQMRISGTNTERVIAEILNRVPVPTNLKDGGAPPRQVAR